MKEKAVPYVTFAERYGMEKGLEMGRKVGFVMGLAQAIGMILTARFGAGAESLIAEIRQLTNADQLERILQAAVTATSLDELKPLVSGPPTNSGNSPHS